MTTMQSLSVYGNALADLIRSNISEFKLVSYDPDEFSRGDYNTPFALVYCTGGDSDERVGQNYIDTIDFVIEIGVTDISHYGSAAETRDALFLEVRNLIRDNSRFHPDLLTSRLRGYTLTRAIDVADENFFVSLAQIEVEAEIYNDL